MLPVPDWMVYATAFLAWGGLIYMVVRDWRAESKKKENKQ